MALLASMACHHVAPAPAPLPSPKASPTPQNDNDYVDLVAGSHLLITVPYLRGGHIPEYEQVEQNGGVITLKPKSMIGFQVSVYVIEKATEGRVSLRFESARTTKNGKTTGEAKPPHLPIPLPADDRFVRLVYFVRSSRADHNMAVIAAPDLTLLNAFTSQIMPDPSVCRTQSAVSCVWVPTGVAVKPD